MINPELSLYEESDVKKRELLAKEIREGELKSLLAVLEGFHGRKTLWRYLEKGRVFHTTYVPGDAHASAYLEGQRAHALAIMNDIIDADPDRFVEMMKEAKDKKYDELHRTKPN